MLVLSTVPVSLFVPIVLRISQIRSILPEELQSGSAAEEEEEEWEGREGTLGTRTSSAKYKMRNDKDETGERD